VPSVAFSIAVAFLIDRIEGASALVSDTGGKTRFGISQRAYPDVDIEHLTRLGAEAIYQRDYWRVVRGDDLPPGLALLVFDAAVNMGTGRAVTLLQRVLRLREDGIAGPETVRAAGAFKPPSELRALYNDARLTAYDAIATKGAEFAVQLTGWRRRLFRVADEAGRWSAAA
jgi:lysozyme family protein